MTFFEMFGTVTLPVSVKNWLSISLREVCLHSKFGKLSFLTRKNMTDKQNHMTMSILLHQHLLRIELRLFTKRCISYLSFVTKPHLGKESSGSASVYEISTANYIAWFPFHCLSEDSCFETTSMVENFFVNFLFNFVSPTLSHFLITKNT